MNPEVKALWTAALRSGDYTQGKGKLSRKGVDGAPDQDCCLGVLTKLAVEAGIAVEVANSDSAIRTYRDGVDGASWAEGSVPPRVVIQWAGLSEQNPTIEGVSFEDEDGEARSVGSLAEANDKAGYTFEQIADLIDAQF